MATSIDKTFYDILNSYKEAIDILQEIDSDDGWELAMDIIILVAKNNPEVLVDNYNRAKYNRVN